MIHLALSRILQLNGGLFERLYRSHQFCFDAFSSSLPRLQRIIFFLSAGLYVLSAIFFVMFASGNVQWWNQGGERGSSASLGSINSSSAPFLSAHSSGQTVSGAPASSHHAQTSALSPTRSANAPQVSSPAPQNPPAQQSKAVQQRSSLQHLADASDDSDDDSLHQYEDTDPLL
eukprot:m.591620 g.591620  ORF g.591620 m.591620 type:complete len:174 (-) comp58018_c0_seq1:22-543(-)